MSNFAIKLQKVPELNQTPSSSILRILYLDMAISPWQVPLSFKPHIMFFSHIVWCIYSWATLRWSFNWLRNSTSQYFVATHKRSAYRRIKMAARSCLPSTSAASFISGLHLLMNFCAPPHIAALADRKHQTTLDMIRLDTYLWKNSADTTIALVCRHSLSRRNAEICKECRDSSWQRERWERPRGVMRPHSRLLD